MRWMQKYKETRSGAGTETRGRAGFTLVELVVVISIMAVVLAGGVASFRKFSQKQILTDAARELKNTLRLAQTNAATGEKGNCACGDGGDNICGTPDDETIAGWEVDFGSGNYKIYGVCESGTVFNLKGVLGSKSRTDLPPGLRINPVPAPVRFKVLSRGTNLTGDMNIRLNGFDKTQVVTVTVGGGIK